MARRALRGRHHFLGQFRVVAVDHAARARVGAGDVELVSVNALAGVRNLDRAHVVVSRVAEDVDNAARLEGAEKGQLFFQEFPGAHVLQADGVEHP